MRESYTSIKVGMHFQYFNLHTAGYISVCTTVRYYTGDKLTKYYYIFRLLPVTQVRCWRAGAQVNMLKPTPERVLFLFALLCSTSQSKGDPLPLPSWNGPVPSISLNKSAGLPPVPGVSHFTVYNSTTKDGKRNPDGTYNHGPMMIAHDGIFYMSWYNSPRDENLYKRSVFSTSGDEGETWSAPVTLFPNFTKNGNENGPWTLLGDSNTGPESRLYSQSGTLDAGLHEEGIQSVMRRVGPGSKLGPIFWLNETVPPQFKHLNFPTYLEMDPLTRRDASQLLASFVRTTVKYPDFDKKDSDSAQRVQVPAVLSPHERSQKFKERSVDAYNSQMLYNERSLYKVPGTRQIVNLLRGEHGSPKNLSASVCTLPLGSLPPVTPDRTLFSCRPGAGDAFMNLVEVLELPASALNNTKPIYEPRVCNFSDPVYVSIPDSHSRTCASLLPGGAADGKGDAIYLVGNQIHEGRDPVTLSVARDGLQFNDHWAVRYGAPPVRYPGNAKGKGFQYPGAMIRGGFFYVSYSIGKEDIGFSKFPLESILAKVNASL